MSERNRLNAASKVRKKFVENKSPLTMNEIYKGTDLEYPAISMAISYLMRQKYVSRESISNPLPMGRRTIWQYTYHSDRLV